MFRFLQSISANKLILQARNQEFFRAGEVSENKGTSINNIRKKGPAGEDFGDIFPIYA